jgi:hypothetical protein
MVYTLGFPESITAALYKAALLLRKKGAMED